MHTCAYCGRTLPWLHRVVGQLRFCSREHARLHGLREAAGAQKDGAGEGAAPGNPAGSGQDASPEAADPESAAARETDGSRPAGQVGIPEPADALPEELPDRAALNPDPAGRLEAGAAVPAEAGVIGAEEPWDRHDDVDTADEADAGDTPGLQHTLPLRGMVPLPGRPPDLRRVPFRPPRRRIIVPSHRPPRKRPALTQADEIPASASLRPLKPPARRGGPAPQPVYAALQEAMPEFPRRRRRSAPESGPSAAEKSGVLTAMARLTAVGGMPVPSAGPPAAWQLQPLPGEGPLAAPCRSPSFPPRLGPVAVLGPSVPPLEPPAPERERKPSLAGLMHGGMQPFRLPRPPQRPLRLGPGMTVRPEPLETWPLPVRSTGSPALFVPRPTAMPLRPSYSFGPPPEGEAFPAEGTGAKSARQVSSMPQRQMAGG